MEPAGRPAEERGFLVKIDIDAAKEDGGGSALVGFIESEGQVERDHRDVMAHSAKFRDQRVIAEAKPAIHCASAGGDLDDVHPLINCRKRSMAPIQPVILFLALATATRHQRLSEP